MLATVIEHEDEDDLEGAEMDEDQDVAISAETMKGDIRQAFMDRVRAMSKPYQQMTQGEQTSFAWAMNNLANDIVNKALAVAKGEIADKVVTIKAQVGDVKRRAKDGHIEGKFGVLKTAEHVMALLEDLTGRDVEIRILPSAQSLKGEKQTIDAEVKADQGELLQKIDAAKPDA